MLIIFILAVALTIAAIVIKVIDRSDLAFIICTGVAVVVWGIFLFQWRTWIHWFAMIFYVSPLFSVIGTILFLAVVILFFMSLFDGFDSFKLATTAASILVIVFLIFLGTFGSAWQAKALYDNTVYKKVKDLPKTTSSRLLPYEVAEKYLEDSFQISEEELANYSIVNHNGELFYQGAKVPDGFWNYFNSKMGGVMEIPINSSKKDSKKIRNVNFSMEMSEGIAITDSIKWNLYKDSYWIDINESEIFYVKDDKSEYVAVVPFIEYKWAFPIRYPAFGGVYIVEQDGSFEKISPKECDNCSFLKDQIYYPASLERQEVEAYAAKNGVMNMVFYHKDQIEVVDEDISSNKQPYLLMTEGGPMWFVAAEPQGESHGVSKIFARSATNSNAAIQVLEYPKDSQLIGANNIKGYIKSSENTGIKEWDSYSMIESKPVIFKNDLYWQLSVIPSSEDGADDYAGVFMTVFVNAASSKLVYAFKDDKNAICFSKGEWDMKVFNDFNTPTTKIDLKKTNTNTNNEKVKADDMTKEEMLVRVKNAIKELETLEKELSK